MNNHRKYDSFFLNDKERKLERELRQGHHPQLATQSLLKETSEELEKNTRNHRTGTQPANQEKTQQEDNKGTKS